MKVFGLIYYYYCDIIIVYMLDGMTHVDMLDVK